MATRKKASAKHKCDGTFAKVAKTALALGYNDVRLKTGYSEVLPKDADLRSRFSRNIPVNLPIISSPMDTVTEYEMAIAMAQLGGLGIIHRNLTPKDQASAVGRVKHQLNAFISDPVCVRASQTVNEVLVMVEEKKYEGRFLSFPVLSNAGRVIGIVARSNFEFCMDTNKKIADIMVKEVIGAPEGTDVKTAYRMMMKHHIKILPVFSRQNDLVGIYTKADVQRIVKGNSVGYNLTDNGTLRVGAAIGVGEEGHNRMDLLAKAKVDVVVIDTAHGDSKGVIEMLKYCKRTYPGIDIVAGNVSQGESARRLVKAGADGVRVGQGPGSICTTRIVAGVGCPQVTAVYNCAKALRGSGVPVCADGGIENSGDIPIAFAAGAGTVMLGKLLAGTTESPGEVILGHNGERVKSYRGMGSLGAMRENKASRERYKQDENAPNKLVPEGVEGEVSFKGNVEGVLDLLVGGLRAGMGYCGAKTIADLQTKGDFDVITGSGLKESHPHGLEYYKAAPNYGG